MGLREKLIMASTMAIKIRHPVVRCHQITTEQTNTNRNTTAKTANISKSS